MTHEEEKKEFAATKDKAALVHSIRNSVIRYLQEHGMVKKDVMFSDIVKQGYTKFAIGTALLSMDFEHDPDDDTGDIPCGPLKSNYRGDGKGGIEQYYRIRTDVDDETDRIEFTGGSDHDYWLKADEIRSKVLQHLKANGKVLMDDLIKDLVKEGYHRDDVYYTMHQIMESLDPNIMFSGGRESIAFSLNKKQEPIELEDQ